MDRLPLRDLQLRLRELIASTRDVPASELDLAATALGIRSDARLAAGRRVAIYRGMYFLRLRDALEHDFGALRRALGREPFDALVRLYLDAHPSDRPSLRDLGRHLPAFVRSGAAHLVSSWQRDLAALEWAMVDAFDAADEDVLVATRLEALDADDWPALRLQPVASSSLLACTTPVDDLREQILACEPADDPAPVAGDDVNDAPDARRDGASLHLRVWRQDGTVFHRRMDDVEAAALAWMRDGVTFADLCGWLDERTAGDDVASDALRLLRRWLDDGLLIAS